MTKAQQLGITKFPYKEFDDKGNLTYFETYYEYWWKCEYNKKGNRTYYENSNGYWVKREYDANGNRTYYENSDGIISNNRPK